LANKKQHKLTMCDLL